MTSTDTTLWHEESIPASGHRRVRAHIGGLHCSLCTSTIEKALGRKPGVDKVAVSLTHEQALVEFDPAVTGAADLMQTLQDIGYTLSDPRKLEPFIEQERALTRERNRFLAALGVSLGAIGLIATPAMGWGLALSAFVATSLLTLTFIVLRNQGVFRALLGTLATAAGGIGLYVLRLLGLVHGVVPWMTAALALTLILGLGRHILMMALQTLRRGILNQHVLVEIGAFAGFAGGVLGFMLNRPGYPTAAFFAVAVMVLTYHIFSEWLSLIVKTRSSQAVKRLLDLQPDRARVLRDGGEEDLPVEDVCIGDRVRIRPGERIPVDGEVVDGRSAVNESLITGEPLPVDKQPGNGVVGGAINGMGTLVVRVSAAGDDSFLQGVVRSVEDARALKPGLLHLVDRVLRIYTPAVMILSFVVLLGWFLAPVVFGTAPDLQRAIFAALSVLVMGYPCAVGISAPLAIVRGAGEAADRGVVMRTGEAFQALRRVRTVVFDKTGTLTRGQPSLQRVVAVDGDKDTVLALAASAETASEHPLAEAVVASAFERQLTIHPIEDFEATAGKGVLARVDHQGRILVGSPRFAGEQGVDLTPLTETIEQEQAAGRTVIVVAREGALLGLLALGDALREDAVTTVAGLRQQNIQVVLLTGDHERTARQIAEAVGIEEVHASILPEQKAQIIRQLQHQAPVAMVGDGINDAPALMQADVGIAMGSGTDIAIDAADIILLNTRLASLLVAFDTSRRGYRKMVQNIALAFLFNGIGLPLAATGLVYPVWAMLAMAASVTTIFINSLAGRSGLFLGAVGGVGNPRVQ